mgnify:FL=1
MTIQSPALNQDEAFIILHEKPNPTSEFYIEPLLQSKAADYRLCSLIESPPVITDNSQKISLIIVRYLNSKWRKWIDANRNHIQRIIYFMDDDVFDPGSHKHLPLDYQFKLFRLAYRFRSWVLKNTELWVSTDFLKKKYFQYNPKIIQPAFPYNNQNKSKCIFYHGSSATHNDEMRWLHSIIKEVLSEDPSVFFEIIGGPLIRLKYAKLPRVNVISPLSWQDYKSFLSLPGRTIGLAPLMDNPFNAARSHVKFYDITHAGAIGIYADHPSYRDMVIHDENGILLPMDKKLWVKAILELANDENRCKRLFKAAQASL